MAKSPTPHRAPAPRRAPTSAPSAARAKPTAARTSSAEIAAEYLLPADAAPAPAPIADSRRDDQDLDSGSVGLQATYARLDHPRRRARKH